MSKPIGLYAEVGKLTGKDPRSVERFADREALFPDLVEMVLEHDAPLAVKTLAKLVKGNRRVRNARRSK